MNREKQIDSTIDSILNEDKGVTTSYERQRNKDEETLYEILSRMNSEKLEKTKQTIEKLQERLKGKQIDESNTMEESSKQREQSIYNSLDGLI